ncbi:MAG TPA: ATP-binding protein [Pyrinomonadaceae bacterium]|nr:ATP-binding protein [Pyrinomonadaceae bacterium]
MSLLEALQLIGYSLGAVLPLWMGYLLFKQRLGVVQIQRLLLGLGICMVGWHAGNLVVTLRSLLGLEVARWDSVLRAANSIAVISITICYSLLLHVHIHLWANAQGRDSLTRIERIRVFLSYIPCLFLVLVVPKIWLGPYQPMIAKLSQYMLPFVAWVVYSLIVVSITELLVARRAASASERRILRTLAFSFLIIAVLILTSLGLGLGQGTVAGQYLQTVANLGSLLPSALLAYYIYRYRYLELIIKESLIVATFAAVVLAVYLYGIRRIGEWANARYGLRAGVVEAILILALTLLAAPLRGWLEKRFRALFERETALYRDVVARVGAQAGQYRQLPEFLDYVESQTAAALSLSRVKIVLRPADQEEENESTVANESQPRELLGLLRRAEADGAVSFEDDEVRAAGYQIAYGVRREDRTSGLLLIDASSNALTTDVRAVLEVLAGQVAIAIEDFRLANENVQLERKLAEGERLAALGQMAATVAHEVKNPLSAIKSIAQVMSEDEALKTQHARDLSLIVGETDRLSKSVTQLLSFASKRPPAATPCRADELLRTVTRLFGADAGERSIHLQSHSNANVQLDGVQAGALRDALANLLLNALQATPSGGQVTVESFEENGEVVFAVNDSGPGIAAETRARIWEPFFTTRQRGTGLGLAIVRKRMEDAGGSARLLSSQNGRGARFELRLPVSEARP